MGKTRLNIDCDKCIGCGLCVKTCPANNLSLKNGKAEIYDDECMLCGHCTAVCPKNALEVKGYESDVIPKTEDVRLDPDEVLNVIRYRRTVRQYEKKSIPQEIIEKILEAGRLTHTAKNMQDVSFTVLEKEKDAVEKLAVKLFRKVKPIANIFSATARRNEIGDDFFFFGAPTVIVIAAKDIVNGVLAAQNMEFMAEAYGLGVLYSGFFTSAANASRKIRKKLGLPRGKKAAMTLVIGYPQVKFLRSVKRKSLDAKYM